MRRGWRRAGTVTGGVVGAAFLIAGVVVWANPEPMVLPGTVYGIERPIAVTDDLLVGTSPTDETGEDVLKAVSLDDGSTVWKRPGDWGDSEEAVESGVLVHGDQQEWTGVDLETGKDLWTARAPWTDDEDAYAMVTVVDDGTVLISRRKDGMIGGDFGALALDARSGEKLWTASGLVFTSTGMTWDNSRVVRSPLVIESRGDKQPLTIREVRTGTTVATIPHSYSVALIGKDLIGSTGDSAIPNLTTVRRLASGRTLWTAYQGIDGLMDGSPSSTTCLTPESTVIDAASGRALAPPAPWALPAGVDDFTCPIWARVQDGDSAALWRVGTDEIRALPDQVPQRGGGGQDHIYVAGERGAIVVGTADDRLGFAGDQTDVWFDGKHSVWRSEELVAAGGFGNPDAHVRITTPEVRSLWTDHGYLAFQTDDGGTRLVDLER